MTSRPTLGTSRLTQERRRTETTDPSVLSLQHWSWHPPDSSSSLASTKELKQKFAPLRAASVQDICSPSKCAREKLCARPDLTPVPSSRTEPVLGQRTSKLRASGTDVVLLGEGQNPWLFSAGEFLLALVSSAQRF